MTRRQTWWGTAPLLAGAGGLLLLAFGARGMQDRDPGSADAQQLRDEIKANLEDAENRREVRSLLAGAEAAVKIKYGKSVDLQSLAPKKGEEADPQQIADQAYERIRAAMGDQHIDPGLVVAERIAFYCGLVLVFAAGVLLYRRTPDSVQAAW